MQVAHIGAGKGGDPMHRLRQIVAFSVLNQVTVQALQAKRLGRRGGVVYGPMHLCIKL